jgi:hypothetical protein
MDRSVAYVYLQEREHQQLLDNQRIRTLKNLKRSLHVCIVVLSVFRSVTLLLLVVVVVLLLLLLCGVVVW